VSLEPIPTATADQSTVVDAEHAEIDELLALVDHELRNPLHGLMLQVVLAKSSVAVDSPALDRIAKVEATLKRYSNRVTVLLELLRPRPVEFTAQCGRVDVAAIVRTIVDAESAQARARKVEVTLTSDTQCVADSDPVLLEEIVDNLLLNAFKHAACTRVEVSVRCAKDTVEISVTDDGVGISADDQARIFNKFEVAQHSRRGNGSGLGLWIVRRLATTLGGGVELHSAPGAGSRFTVTIPRWLTKDAP
jgi:signal transduction histidine kinase